jgi:hypothetical protein
MGVTSWELGVLRVPLIMVPDRWDQCFGRKVYLCLGYPQRFPLKFSPISLFYVTSSTFHPLSFYLPQQFPLYYPLYPTTTIKYHYLTLFIFYYYFFQLLNRGALCKRALQCSPWSGGRARPPIALQRVGGSLVLAAAGLEAPYAKGGPEEAPRGKRCGQSYIT